MSRSRKKTSRNGAPAQPPADSHTAGVRPFRFKHDGEVYFLPPAREGAKLMTAGDMIDATEGDETAQMRFFLAMLRATKPAPEAMAALRAMSIERFGSVMREWTEKTGGHLGKSGRSSD